MWVTISPKLFSYLLPLVEEEQRGISPDSVVRTRLIVLGTVNLHKEYMDMCFSIKINKCKHWPCKVLSVEWSWAVSCSVKQVTGWQCEYWANKALFQQWLCDTKTSVVVCFYPRHRTRSFPESFIKISCSINLFSRSEQWIEIKSQSWSKTLQLSQKAARWKRHEKIRSESVPEQKRGMILEKTILL